MPARELVLWPRWQRIELNPESPGYPVEPGVVNSYLACLRQAWVSGKGDEVVSLPRHPNPISLFAAKPVRPLGGCAGGAFRKLAILDATSCFDDLQIPPGNRLEPLRGDRHGQHSIRINDRCRLCFVWTEAGLDDIEIVDIVAKQPGGRAAVVLLDNVLPDNVLLDGNAGKQIRENLMHSATCTPACACPPEQLRWRKAWPAGDWRASANADPMPAEVESSRDDPRAADQCRI